MQDTEAGGPTGGHPSWAQEHDKGRGLKQAVHQNGGGVRWAGTKTD